jgi:RNA polymerase II subunit A-like phosphatase
MAGMCADCGADLRQNEDMVTNEIASVPMIHSVPDLKVTQELAEKIGRADTDRLLHDKKLVLLVDLDQTLIHTTNDNIPNNLKDVYHFQLYGPNSPWYHTRLRPGTPEFLANIDPYFELHICTFGARHYAHMIAQFLDEKGRLFSHRILSRDECLNATSKKDNLKALFPDQKYGDSMVCIIDDREDVWNNASNLIQVKPYHFFQHTGDINAPPGLEKHELDGKGVDFKEIAKKQKNKLIKKAGEQKSEDLPKKSENSEVVDKESSVPSESESSKDETSDASKTSDEKEPEKEEPSVKKVDDDNLIEVEDGDDYLLYLEHILKKVHERFYKIYEETGEVPDLKKLIPQVKSEVLVGISMVFSGLVPNHIKLENSKSFQIAQSLGAKVSESFAEDTTHLVAATTGTNKVNQARKVKNLKIVTPEWLWTCAERWEHVDERLYPLSSNKNNKMRNPPAHCHSPPHKANYNESKEAESPKFSDTINPLLAFSNDDIDAMNEDFQEFFESDSSSDEPRDIENPPIEKSLRKRKIEEAEKNNQKIFFKDNEEKWVDSPEKRCRNNENDEDGNESRSSKSSSSSEEESPVDKFRRGELIVSE